MKLLDQTQATVDVLRQIPYVNVMVCPEGTVIKPDFIRFPNPGERCPVTSLGRSTLRRIIAESGGKVILHYLKREGATRGIRFIHRQSLVDYINSFPLYQTDEDVEEEDEATATPSPTAA